MNLKTLLIHLFKEDTPDEEDHVGEDSRSTGDPEKFASGFVRGSGMTDQVDADQDQDDEQEHDDVTPTVDLDNEPGTHTRRMRRIFSFLFPSPSDEEEIQAYIPHYRILPILSGIAIPFCILLEIPGVTEPWYISMDDHTEVASKQNPPFFDIGIALSIACGVSANVFLIIRFLEKRIKTMTILCVVFLSTHDVLNITALAIFGATSDGYTYGQAFWMTLLSTIVSIFTNVTLIIDLIRTSDFKRSGSGLTRRQRSLVIIIIGLFCYLALGALINALLLDLTFINGLYFTVVTIETIGFGDIVPTNTRSRVFICFYATLGIINLAFVVGYIRETVLEGLDFRYRARLLAIQERRRAAGLRRRAERRWRHAVVWRLRQRNVPLWIRKTSGDDGSLWSKIKSCFWSVWGIVSITRKSTHGTTTHRHGMKLNLWALPQCQLEAAALEAGLPLDTLLPQDFYDTYAADTCYHAADVEHHGLPSWFAAHPVYHRDEHTTEPLTFRRLGVMAAMLTKLSFTIYESGGSPLPHGPSLHDASAADVPDSSGSLATNSSVDTTDYRTDVAQTEHKAYTTRSSLSWGWFLIFWLGGAAIFKATEGWPFGLSVYFCFIAFSTIGYGDLAPTTPAGRCIFVLWALVGVATMTIFISVVSDAYTSRYKAILGRSSFKHVVQQYRKRTKSELKEKVERIETSTEVRFDLRNAFKQEQQADVVEESPRTSGGGDVDDSARATASKRRSESDVHIQRTQRSLEQLPQRILTEARSIQQYMQLIGDEGSSQAARTVHQTLWALVDEVMNKQVPESTKIDIMKDGESRQTLVMLAVERSLKELVNISEQATTAVQERNRIMATLEGEEGQDETEDSQALM